METKLFWTRVEVSNFQPRLKALQEAWTSSSETQWATLAVAILETGHRWCTGLWCNKPQISMNSLKIMANKREEEVTSDMETIMKTTWWTDSAQRSLLETTWTMFSQVHRATAMYPKTSSSRLSITSWSKKSSTTSRWWVRTPKIVSKCLTKELEEG